MIKLLKLVVVILGGSLALSGCAKDRAVGLASTIEVAALSELPAPNNVQPVIIGPKESIEVIVAGSDLLSGTFLVDAEGYIGYPLIGDLYVAEKTSRQTARMIANRLRGEFLVDPQVRVRPSNPIVQNISIGGQVTRPGTYPAGTSQTLIRALNNAGGLAEYAKVDDVLIMRTVGGQRYIGVYNIEAIQRGNYADPVIYPNDIVTVGDSPGRRNLENILQFIPLLSTSVILFDRVIGN